MNKLVVIPVLALTLVVIDWYAFQAVRTSTQHLNSNLKQVLHLLYWGLTLVTIGGLLLLNFGDPDWLGRTVRIAIMVLIFTQVLSKLLIIFFLLIDEIWRILKWIWAQGQSLFSSAPTDELAQPAETLSRSEFLSKAGLIAATIPIVGVSYGIISGAHDYRVRRRKVVLPNLPKAWDGVRIAQISDVHSGSFWNKTAVEGGISMIKKEKADMVFFTGDLVNSRSDEMLDYIEVFDKIKAPLGVYSTLGNHDYGDYAYWPSAKAKQQNLQQLIDIHKAMGWDILINENRILRRDGEALAIIGVENWSAHSRFPKYGNLSQAVKGTEEAPVKLLLSHDPSHWMAEVVQKFPQIDLTFSGHTHGMQFGVDIKGFKWSPVQYVYKEWADLYQHKHQYLYVNRGYGYLGFPGRIGIPPEITIMELKRA